MYFQWAYISDKLSLDHFKTQNIATLVLLLVNYSYIPMKTKPFKQVHSIISYDSPRSFSLDLNHQIFFSRFLGGGLFFILFITKGFPGSSAGKESACNAGDHGLIPGSGRSPGEGIGYPFQYSWASLVAQTVKNLLAMWENWV